MRHFYYIILLFYINTFSQVSKKDSLFIQLKTASSKEDQAKNYLELARYYRLHELDSAMLYAKKGFDIVEILNDEKLKAESLILIGNIYVRKNQYENAKKQYNKALNILQKDKNSYDYCTILLRIGNIDIILKKYEDALIKYHECLDICKKNNYSDLYPHLYNNIGYLYLELDDYIDSKKYLDIAYNEFLKNNDQYNLANTLSSLATINKKIGKTNLAIKQNLEVLTIYKKHGNWEDFLFPYNSLIEIYLDKKEYANAKKYLNLAMQVLNNKQSPTYIGPTDNFKTELYYSAARLFLYTNDIKNSAIFAHKSLELAKQNSFNKNISDNAKLLYRINRQLNNIDSAFIYNDMYLKYNDIYIAESNIKKATQIKMQYQFEDILKQKEIETIKSQANTKRNELIYLGVSIIAILGIVILLLLNLYLKTKTTKLKIREEKLELEKLTLKQDVEYKSKELASKTINLLEKNEFIHSLSQKLKSIKPEIRKEKQGTIQEIINELNQNSSTKVWNEFEIRFKEVHSSFYDTLYKLYPDLTPNEIKICAFLRLNMSTKDISAITHQSIKSISMARFRLRKKLSIESDENLINYLTQLK